MRKLIAISLIAAASIFSGSPAHAGGINPDDYIAPEDQFHVDDYTLSGCSIEACYVFQNLGTIEEPTWTLRYVYPKDHFPGGPLPY